MRPYPPNVPAIPGTVKCVPDRAVCCCYPKLALPNLQALQLWQMERSPATLALSPTCWSGGIQGLAARAWAFIAFTPG